MKERLSMKLNLKVMDMFKMVTKLVALSIKGRSNQKDILHAISFSCNQNLLMKTRTLNLQMLAIFRFFVNNLKFMP